MRCIAAASIIAAWLALACDGQEAAKKTDEKASEAKTEPAKTELTKTEPAKTEPAKTEPAPAPTPSEADTAPPRRAPPVAADGYGKEFCATIIPCYQKLEFAGSFTADVSVDIEPDGSVSAVSFTGEVPKPIKSCITDAIKGIELDPYNGKPGRARCTKSGQLMGGTQMIMSDHEYEERDPAASEAKGKTKAKGKGG